MTIQWRVDYLDGSFEEGADNLSSFSFNNPNKKLFALTVDSWYVVVNLETGTISFSDRISKKTFELLSPYENETYRLIYFRRVTVDVLTRDAENVPYVGWQITRNNVNKKRIYKITDKITEVDD